MRRALALMTRLELSLVPTETDDGPRLGRVIGLEDAAEALTAMSRPPETVGMTVVRL